MKYIIAIIALFLSINIGNAQGITFFHGTWQEALDKANEEGKLIFVDAYTKWCGPCKRMSKNVFTLKEVGDYFNDHFINVKMDMEAPESMYFAGKYSVRSYPTLFFIDGEGKIATKSVGGKTKDSLLDFGKKGLLSGNKSEKYSIIYKDGNRDFDFMLKYIKELNSADKPSLKIANDYLNSKPDITNEQLNEFVFESMIDVDSRIFDLFVKNKKQIIDIKGMDSYENRVLRSCKNTLKKAIEFESEELLEVAINACKNQAKTYYSEFKYSSEKRYYLDVVEEGKYVKSVSRYYKKIAKKDAPKLKSLIKEMMSNFKGNIKLEKLLDKYIVQLLKKDKKVESFVFAGQYYYKNKEKDKAIKYIELAIELAKENKKSTKRLEMLIKNYRNG